MTATVENAAERIDIGLVGMTCAACAARIEKKLNRLDGVTATVNYATEKAAVTFDPSIVDAGDLVAAVESIGYGAHLPSPDHDLADDADGLDHAADDHARDLGRLLLVAIVLGVPVLLLSMISALQFRGWQWVSLALATPVAAWSALPFHRSAWRNARQAEASMDTLVSLGVLAAWAWSLYALAFTMAGNIGTTMTMTLVPRRGESHHLYLEVASTTVALVLAGRWFEARAKRRAGGALRALLHLGATDVAVVAPDGREVQRPVAMLRVGDRFVVRPGEKVATDGEVEQGTSAVDASLITGESVPVDVGPGDTVIGATMNTTGRLVVRATRVGADTALAQIARLVEHAQSGKAPVQRLADRVAGVFVPVVMVIAAATLGFWFARTGSLAEAMTPAVAVLIIACPCALGLATPMALLVGTGRGAQLGILIKGPEVLESTRRADTVVLDKTGTVTTGAMRVVDVVAAEGSSPADVVALAAAVERNSEHPIAHAIVRHADGGDDGDDARLIATEFASETGVGAGGIVDGRRVRVGRGDGGSLAAAKSAAEAAGGTVVVVSVDDDVVGIVAVADTVKPTSAAAVRTLQTMGIRVLLVSGDNSAAAAMVAAAVGIEPDDVHAGALPADKVAIVSRLQRDGHVVGVVGDGVNDAAALAQSDLGIAMGTGTDVAIEASDLTLVRPELTAAVDAIRLSRRTLAVIKGNLFWAFAYNVAAIPLACGWLLSPVVASAAMTFSSAFVVTNSLRLRRFQPADTSPAPPRAQAPARAADGARGDRDGCGSSAR